VEILLEIKSLCYNTGQNQLQRGHMAQKQTNYLKGASVLAVAGILSRLLGLAYKIPLYHMVGSYGNGLYGNVTNIYNLLLMVSTVGLPVAISKMITESISEGDYCGTRDVFKVSMTTLIVIGGLSSLILLLGADFIINFSKWPGDTYPGIMGIALAPFIISICACFRGFFQGHQLMNPTAISQILEQVVRVFLGMFLCWFGVYRLNSIGMGVGGAVFGATAGGMVAMVFLWYSYRAYIQTHAQRYKKRRFPKIHWKDIFKRLLIISIPVTLTATVVSLFSAMDSMIYVTRLGNIGIKAETAIMMYGDFTNADTIINVPLVISGTLSVALIPAITESYMRRNRREMNAKITSAIRVVALVAIPSCIGLIVLSQGIFDLLFRGSDYGPTILKYYAFATIFMMLSNTFQSILQAINRFRLPLVHLAVATVIRFATAWIFLSVPQLNINGISISSIITFLYLTVANYLSVKYFTKIKLNFAGIVAKPIFASLLMGLGVYGIFQLVLLILGHSAIANALAVVTAIVVGVVIYMATILLTDGIREEELEMFPASSRLIAIQRRIKKS